ncbi:MAG: DEAD/DEAH box helicase [Kiritimatiellaeota bacterium]|nr:DEAD/DEAH box helicase [Kiritimatiellota bacterium]
MHLAATKIASLRDADVLCGRLPGVSPRATEIASLRDVKGGDGSPNRPDETINSGAFRALVVCPKSVVSNWSREISRFAPSLDDKITVVNYAQLRNQANLLTSSEWDAAVLDEGQNIKNPNSQNAKAAREIRAAHRLVLTGTPVENRLLDLWSLFAFAMPGLLGTQASFNRLYNIKKNPAAQNALAARVKHFMLRRTKAQVAQDLPPRVEEELFVEMEGAQRKLYDAELKRARAALMGVKSNSELDKVRFNILQHLLRLRQICCDPRLISDEIKNTESAKLEALIEQLETIRDEGGRALVFSQFTSMLDLIAARLRDFEIPYLTITGKTENRQSVVDKFQAPDGPPVFLLSLKAAGSGLNLTAAGYVFLYDPWWNPAVEAQAIDRTHRIGQTSQVMAYRLLAKDSIEEKIRLLQAKKRELAEAVVGEETISSVLDLDDLQYVLS